ncbi:SGNH/GDSL hydrolase family protein [Streptomyces sp. 35G-GA-8]|uniref:SGNH/GDSL hydrolase family protein n=1 Tax=Streptomyces sp. 35G-GA-8 TaxID=2939434 RepID=UPI00201E85A5|nr:SGNH/GDSL hydrolase family protein [Streptomyces sp. 35G-GA-8]MCL7380520.1 SGNH/GDSL hydrolase family protein [Streptomyces sp. 35G-GA-8]
MPRFRKKLAGAAAVAALCLLGAGTSASAPAAAAASSLQWVALGDSYTAGAIPAAGDTFEYPRDGCQRTTESYPEIIRRDFGSLVHLRNVSCGSATIANVYREEQTPTGYELHIPGLIDQSDPDYPFAPVPPQIDALSPSTDLVSVGVGGNSLGFGELLGKCIELGPTGSVGSSPCKDHFEAGMPARLETVRREYDQMLTAIHAKAPFAKVITVGYPTVIPDDPANCLYSNPLQFSTTRHADLNWLRESALEPLNAIIQQVTAAHGDRYVDIYSSSKGHSVCAPGQEKWTEGILQRLQPPTWALVHPNARGHANAAAQVEDAILGG